MLRNLELDWHWHIVEGMAKLENDTGWPKVFGGRIPQGFDRSGLSNDGTTEYLDYLERRFPDRVSIYRKNAFWNGKVEMCNSFISKLPESCLLWQLDVDEFWTESSVQKMVKLFEKDDSKWGAYVYCDYFVGPKKFVVSRNTWATHPEDWLRVFRFQEGFRWEKHEPPTLVDKNGVDWPSNRAFSRDVTLNMGIKFQHFAYSLLSQVEFKQTYYGYKNLVERWESLQKIKGEVLIQEYFPWSDDGAVVTDWDERVHGKLLFSEID